MNIEPRKIVGLVNQTTAPLFTESSFIYTSQDSRRFVSRGTYSAKALNFWRSERIEVDVIKWFREYWVYSEIKFVQSENSLLPFFTFSLFKTTGLTKSQLFRAEWDCYESRSIHPQPHWHFYSNQGIDYLTRTFEDVVASEEESDFIKSLTTEVAESCSEMTKMHFAMRGMWEAGAGHVHKIGSDKQFVNWISGLLLHIRSQLEYA